MFTQILQRARKNVAVHSGGDIFTQSLREHVKMLQSIVEEIYSPRFYGEHGKMLQSTVEEICSPSFYESTENCCTP